MNEPVLRRSAALSWVMFVIGLILTVGLFSGYRPWGITPVNTVFLLGPVVLAAAAAGSVARSGKSAESGRERATAGKVVGIGLLMLLAGGCPWLYTPLFTRGVSNQASGMLGTVIFLLVSLPGLAVTGVGLTNLASQRRARKIQKPTPGVGGLEE
jgi:hypothetical protein